MRKAVVVLSIAGCLVALLVWRSRFGDEKRIAKVIEKGRAAIEAEDIDNLMSVVALTYRDEYGLSYAVVRRAFADMFRNFEHITAVCRVREILIEGDTATASADVSVMAVVEGRRYFVIGRNAKPQAMLLTLAKGELSWKVIASKWDHFPSAEALLERLQFYGNVSP